MPSLHGTYFYSPTTRQASILRIWLPCATAILWMAGFTTPAIKRRNYYPFNSSRTPCGLSRNTVRPITHKKIILPYPQSSWAYHPTADFQPYTQSLTQSQSGVKDAGWADRIGNAIDYLCRSAYVCYRVEKVGSEYCHHFRIAGAFRPIHYTDLLG